jgi:hypothetical protein
MSAPRQPGDDDLDPVDLTAFDDDFAAAELPDRTTPVPDGRYQVRVDNVEITTARSSGNPVLRWTLRIVGPTSRGRLLFRHHVLSTPRHFPWLKHDLCLCGLQITRLSHLPDHLHQLLDLVLEVTQRTRADRRYVFFERLVPTPTFGGGSPPF